MLATAIIPARLGSTRLPGKVLLDVGGRPMIQRVYERVIRAACFRRVIIATESAEVARVCRAFAPWVEMTSAECRSGTERAAEVARGLDDDVIAVVQADEPLLDPSLLDRLFALFADPATQVASAMFPLAAATDANDPNVVKVVTDLSGGALYFSRAPIPWFDASGDGERAASRGPGYGHVGVYFYRRTALCAIAALPPSPLETAERLEQLRALQHGYRIRMLVTAYRGRAIDTAADLAAVRLIIAGSVE